MPYKMNKGDAIIRETVKPSKAAMELAEKVCPPISSDDFKQLTARRIQSALADLLEKARVVADECSGPEHMLDALTKALEPWKAGA